MFVKIIYIKCKYNVSCKPQCKPQLDIEQLVWIDKRFLFFSLCYHDMPVTCYKYLQFKNPKTMVIIN